MPLGPPGEWVPAAMISGTRDDTPGEEAQRRRSVTYRQHTKRSVRETLRSAQKQRVTRTTDTQQGRRVDWQAHQNNVSSVGKSSRCGRAAFMACADTFPLLWPTWLRSTANIPPMLQFLVCLLRADVTQHNCCHFSLKEARTWYMFPTWADSLLAAGAIHLTDSCLKKLRNLTSQAERFPKSVGFIHPEGLVCKRFLKGEGFQKTFRVGWLSITLNADQSVFVFFNASWDSWWRLEASYWCQSEVDKSLLSHFFCRFVCR